MFVIRKVDVSAVDRLLGHGFKEVPVRNPYETKRYSGPCTVVVYQTGTVCIQGRDREARETLELLEKGVPLDPRMMKDGRIIVGSDECLKGDTFGGLVVAAVKADETTRKTLRELGVQDSKKIHDKTVLDLAPKIRAVLTSRNYVVLEVFPREYNRYRSQTILLNRLHSRAIGLLGKTSVRVVDKYPGCSVGGARRVVKAERSYVEVAAASILAREAGLLQLETLSERAGFQVPKGSTRVAWAVKRLLSEGLDPRDFVKLHFRNVQKVLESHTGE